MKKVLGDVKRVVLDYDPKQGYELAGFVWFQGFNDYVDSKIYPERNRLGGGSRNRKNGPDVSTEAARIHPKPLR